MPHFMRWSCSYHNPWNSHKARTPGGLLMTFLTLFLIVTLALSSSAVSYDPTGHSHCYCEAPRISTHALAPLPPRVLPTLFMDVYLLSTACLCSTDFSHSVCTTYLFDLRALPHLNITAMPAEIRSTLGMVYYYSFLRWVTWSVPAGFKLLIPLSQSF